MASYSARGPQLVPPRLLQAFPECKAIELPKVYRRLLSSSRRVCPFFSYPLWRSSSLASFLPSGPLVFKDTLKIRISLSTPRRDFLNPVNQLFPTLFPPFRYFLPKQTRTRPDFLILRRTFSLFGDFPFLIIVGHRPSRSSPLNRKP